MKITTLFNRYLTIFAITAVVLLSGFSFAINWNNSNFIDSTFRSQNPTSGDVKAALFGVGTSTGTAYTNHWQNNTCLPANITVAYVAAGDRNTPPTLTGNTIYVLTGDQTLSAPISINASCVAIIASGTVVIDHSASLTLINSFFIAGSANTGLIIDGIESIGANFLPEADHFLYTNQHDNITVNNIKAERFFGFNLAGGVLYFNGYSDNIGVFNSYIHNNTRRGIQIDTTQNVHIVGNEIAVNTDGILMSSSVIQTRIENNEIHDNQWHGIGLAGSANAINTDMIRNIVYNNGLQGISIAGSSTNMNISKSKIFNNTSAGIRMNTNINTTMSNTIISNTTIHNNGLDGIYAGGGGMVGLVIDTVQSYNNQESAIEIVNTSGTILHNLTLSTTNTYDTLKVTAGANQLSKYYGNIKIYGEPANTPALITGSASDTAVANLGRQNGSMTTVPTATLFSSNSFIFCEIGAFHSNMQFGMNVCSNFGINTRSFPFTNNGEPYYFGEKVLKQTNIPYYLGTVLYPSNTIFNPQLYITDDSFGGWIQTTGGANYMSGLVHYTNTNQLRIYASTISQYNIGGIDFDTNANNFNPAIITGNILTGQQITITLPWTGDNGYKAITGQFTSGTNNTNIYRLFRRYDTTGPDQIVLNTPAQNALVVGNQITLDWTAGVDTGAGISGYNYIVASNSGFTNILFSGTTGALNADFINIGFYPNYYRQVQGFDNLGNLGTATTGLFHYGFRDFNIIPVNTTFPTNSGQTFTVTAYNINNDVITGYTNTVTFSLTGLNTTPQTPPVNYTFTLADTGAHTFTGLLTIDYPGIYTFDVMDTLSGTRLGSTIVTVTGEALDIFSGSLAVNGDPITEPVATSGSTTIETDFPAGTTYGIELEDGTPFTLPGTALNPGDDIVIDLTTSGLPDGSYDITITFTDSSGIYTQTIVVTTILDTTAPILTIQNPETGSYQTLNQPMINRSVTETGAGMSGYNVVMSGTSLVYTAYNHSNNTYREGTPLVDGPRTMTVYGYDNAGNYGTAANSFTIDNTAPILLSGSPHQVVVNNPVTFTRYVSETGGIQNSSFWLMNYYNNSIFNNPSIPGPGTSTTANTLGSLPSGVYRRNVQVQDFVGNTSNRNNGFIFIVTNASPGVLEGFMEFESNQGNIIQHQGTTYTNTTQIQAALYANMAGIVSINGDMLTNNGLATQLMMPFPYSLQPISLTQGDGIKNINPSFFKIGQQTPSHSFTKQITLDTTAPTVPTLITPINGVAVTGAIILSRSGASDAGAGLSQYNIEVATGQDFNYGVRNNGVNGTTTTTTIASGTLTPGQYYRRVITYDRVRNQSISEVESFTIAVPNTTVIVNGTGAIPNTFSIPAINNANPNISYRSSPVTVAGLVNGQQAAVNISAGTLIKNGTSVGTTGTAVNGDILEIDLLASSNYDTQVSSTLTVGTRSAVFNLRTKTQDQSYNGITNTQRLQIRIIFDSMVNTYGINDSRTLTLMMTLRTAIESMLGLTNYAQAQKDALEYFLTLVNGYINERGGTNPFNGATYTARNGRVFSIIFDTTRAAYTSTQFIKPAYFSSWTSMKLHIDIHNPGAGQGVLVGTLNNIENTNRGNNVHVMPNGKIYRVENNGSRYSPDTISQKQFNTQGELLARLRANNQSIKHY